MTNRRERVILELEDAGFTSGMTRAAAATALLNGELNALDGSGLRASSALRQTDRDVAAFQRRADAAGPSIDRLSGRLNLLAQAALVLGPSLVPIGGVGIQAVAGLANQLAAAGLAGGTLVLALQGVGDAVKAIDEYQLKPTAENLAKAEEAMSKLGPEAQNFVFAFQDFQPVLSDLRDAAAEGWMPGLTEAMDHLAELAPRVESLIRAVSETGGGLLARGAEALGGEEWADFWSFLEETMPSTLADVGSIVGSITHALAELWMAFDPLNRSFSAWLVDAARGIDAWASGLSETEGFADFLDYIQRNGPQVGATLGAISEAILKIIEAASPLGGPVLSALEVIADLLGAFADSPLGPKVLTMAAAFVVLNKALTVTQGLLTRIGMTGAAAALGGTAAAGAAASTPLAARISATRASFGQLRTDLAALNSATSAQIRASRTLQETQQRASATMRSYAGTAAKAGAGVAAFAIASGQLGDKIGLQNTAMLALVGSLAGGAGVAVGGAIGAFIDAKEAASAWGDELERISRIRIEPSNFAALGAEFESLRSEIDKQRAWEQETGSSYLQSLQSVVTDPVQSFQYLTGSQTSSSMTRDQVAAMREYEDVLQSIGMIQVELGGIDPFKGAKGVDLITPEVESLTNTVERLAPAVQALGYEWADVADPKIADELQKWVTNSDSAAGRIANVGTAVNLLGDETLTTGQRAETLSGALADLLGPTLNLEAATDGWRASLRQLSDDEDGLIASAGFKGYSEAALKNKELTRSYISDVQARITALVEAGAGEQRVTKAMQASRRELIESGIAAGFSAEEMRKRANAMGLTPKLVRTVFETAGLAEATIQAEAIKNVYNSMPPSVQTKIALDGVPRTMADAKAIIKQLELTGEDRQAVLDLLDLASPKLAKARERAKQLGAERYVPTVDVDDKATPKVGKVKGGLDQLKDKTLTLDALTPGLPAIARMANELAGLRDKTVTITTREVRTFVTPSEGRRSADGSSVPKDGGPYSDRFPYLLAPGEEVISNRYGQADRHRSLLKAINAGRLADGGTTGPLFAGQAVLPASTSPYANPLVVSQHAYLEALLASERALKRELTQREKREQKENDALKRRLDFYKSERDALRSSLEARLTSNIWDAKVTGGLELSRPDLVGLDPAARAAAEAAWGAVNGMLPGSISQSPEDILRADIAQATEMNQLIATLANRGLDDGALASLLAEGSIDQIRGYANGSQEAIDLYEQLYNQRDALVGAAVRSGGEAAWGQEVAALRADLRESNAELRATQKELTRVTKQVEKHLERIAELAPKETGREVGVVVAHELRNAVSSGVKGR